MNKEHPIVQYVARAGIGLIEFASRAGISVASIYRIVNGSQEPSMAAARRIKSASGGAVSIEDLASESHHDKDAVQ